MTEPPRRRVPVAAEQSVREERRSFFRYAAILGVIVGIPLGVFGLPALLNVFFDEPTIPFNGAYSEDGLVMWVESWEFDETHPDMVIVTFSLRVTEASTIDLNGVELELSEGDPIPLTEAPPSSELPTGFDATITMPFFLPREAHDAEPVAVRFRDPKVRFALTEEDH
ncbi:MAG: hypothetical protein F4Z07_01235 [Dehalococcoidia bacterium]|nr:hypothetical protein [Dehalococcoidia bacterium]